MAVYYIRGGPDRIKIGKAHRPEERLKDLQTGSPVVLELLATEPGDRDVECSRHRQFAADRTQGESFVASPELLQHIDEIKTGSRRQKAGRNSSPRGSAEQDSEKIDFALLAWQVQDIGASLTKTALKVLVLMVFLAMCVSVFNKPTATQSTPPPTTVSTSAEAIAPPMAPHQVTAAAAPKRTPVKKRKAPQKRLELPCRPGQSPPCYD